MTDQFDSIQSLLRQVQADPTAAPKIESAEEAAQREADEAEKVRQAIQKFKEEVIADPAVLKRLKRFRREGLYAIRPWQWVTIIVGTPVAIFLLFYFIRLFSDVTRSNMAIRSGLTAIYAGEPATGIEQLQTALRLGSEPALTRLRFATALADMGHGDSATFLFDESAKDALEAGDVGTMAAAACGAAEIFLERNNLEEAVQRVNAVLTVDPRQREALIFFGRILLQMTRYDEAEEAFIKSIERNPSSLSPRWYLRETYLRQGKMVEAREQEDYLLLARPSGDEDIPTLTGYADLLAGMGKYLEAEIALLQILRSTRRPMPDIMVSLGHLAIEKQDFEGAAVYADSAVLIAPGRPEGYVLRAEISYHFGRGREAISDLEKALTLAPRHPAALYTMGCILLYDLRMYENARNHFRRAEMNGFDGPFLHYNIGVSEYYLMRPREALTAFHQMPDYLKGNTDALWTIANASLLAGDFDTAVTIYRNLAEQRDNDPLLTTNLGVTEELLGDTLAAMNRYWAAMSMAKTPEEADTLAQTNINRMIAGRPIANPRDAIHSDVPLRLRGVPSVHYGGRSNGR